MAPPRRASSGPAPLHPPDSRRTFFELAEGAGERFAEASEHGRLRIGASTLRLGTPLPLPLDRLRAGCLGWSVEVRDDAGTADVVFALDPAGPGASTPSAPIIPLARERIRFDGWVADGSPERLLGVAREGPLPDRFDALVHAIYEELRSEDE